MGRLASGALGPEGHFRALPALMLAPPQRAGQALYYFTISLRGAMDAPQLA